MKIISDDVVKKDFIREKRVWAEPAITVGTEGSRVVDKVNDFLTVFDMDSKMWGYAHRLLQYGQVYLKTYSSDFKDHTIDKEFASRKGTIFELVSNPADVVTLEKYGTIVGYGEVIRDSEDKVTDGYNVVGTEEYIHMINDQKMLRQKIKIKYTKSDGVETTDDFNSVIGTAYLEDAREAWAIVDLIETLMLYVRYNKSDAYNLVQVEVGTAGKGETYKILRGVKRILNNQDAMNMKESTYTGYKKPVPYGENVS